MIKKVEDIGFKNIKHNKFIVIYSIYINIEKNDVEFTL